MSTAGDSTLSVVVPCHNGAVYLAAALRSALEQSHAPLEVLVVDDGSTDDSVAIAESFGPPVRSLRQPASGAAAARNRGLDEARGELIAFLDADDLWTPGAIERLVRTLLSSAENDAVIGATEQFASPELDPAARARLRFEPGPFVARLSGALVVRRAAFDRVGRFSTELTTGEFVDWFLRAEDRGVRTVEIPDVVLRRRLHRTNHGVVQAAARNDYVRVIKAALDRRRARPATGAA
jgi:glycosyltransferase involved in cell wall biosynthesis